MTTPKPFSTLPVDCLCMFLQKFSSDFLPLSYDLWNFFTQITQWKMTQLKQYFTSTWNMFISMVVQIFSPIRFFLHIKCPRKFWQKKSLQTKQKQKNVGKLTGDPVSGQNAPTMSLYSWVRVDKDYKEWLYEWVVTWLCVLLYERVVNWLCVTLWQGSQLAVCVALWMGSHVAVCIALWMGSHLAVCIALWMGSQLTVCITLWMGSQLAVCVALWMGSHLAVCITLWMGSQLAVCYSMTG